jgi:hypothetical protein
MVILPDAISVYKNLTPINLNALGTDELTSRALGLGRVSCIQCDSESHYSEYGDN